ncbi:unnamed protein product [Prorocentrum cordatum]|uniref:Uncharacterized protein n=1 Tax=Prorocentrum cordatum TaxID=2364126 RepID=A0ABN9WP28_9DINO|nr:unnamed protein product [Polarella glacialis]
MYNAGGRQPAVVPRPDSGHGPALREETHELSNFLPLDTMQEGLAVAKNPSQVSLDGAAQRAPSCEKARKSGGNSTLKPGTTVSAGQLVKERGPNSHQPLVGGLIEHAIEVLSESGRLPVPGVRARPNGGGEWSIIKMSVGNFLPPADRLGLPHAEVGREAAESDGSSPNPKQCSGGMIRT